MSELKFGNGSPARSEGGWIALTSALARGKESLGTPQVRHSVSIGEMRVKILSLWFLVVASAPLAAQSLVARINAGGGAMPALDGTLFEADAPYVPGVQHGFVGGDPNFAGILPLLAGLLVGGEDNPWAGVFATGRLGWSAYRFDVAPGEYVVRLIFAETYNSGPGLRSQTIAIEGGTVLNGLDLALSPGVSYAAGHAFLVSVSDGVLDIEAQSGPGIEEDEVEAPLLHGVEVWKLPEESLAPLEVSGVIARNGYGETHVNWDWNTLDPTIDGYRVYRSEQSSGRYSVIADLPLGPPRYHDVGLPANSTWFYRVAAVDVTGQEGSLTEPVQATALASALTAHRVYELTVSESDLQFLDGHVLTEPNEEVPATFRFGSFSTPVEVRYRGGVSRAVAKKSWKVKFGAVPFEGRRDVNLKSAFLDGSMLREQVAFGLYAEVGLEPPTIRPVHLLINGRYRGLFYEIEQIDESFLAARGRNLGGAIYKVKEGALEPLPLIEDYEHAYQKKTQVESGHGDLVELIGFVNGPQASNFVSELARRVDLDRLLDRLAVMAVIGERDNIDRNFYLLQDSSLDRWEIVPWDSDFNLALLPANESQSIFWGTTLDPDYPTFVNGLRNAVLQQPAFRWRYLRRIEELDAMWSPGAIALRVNAAHDAVAIDVAADPFKLGWEWDDRFIEQRSTILDSLPLRSAFVTNEIQAHGPIATPTDVWINEVAASPQSIAFDEAGEAEDWVELFNATGAPIDLSGYHLTDDLAIPTLWSMPAGTVVPAGGHILIWCDAEEHEGPLHAPFRLDRDGETVGLFSPTGEFLDSMSFGPQQNELSRGRRSDGAMLLAPMPTPTPGAANTTIGNLPPTLTWVEVLPSFPSPMTPITVTCLARDSDELAGVNLHFRSAPGGFATIAMQPIGSDRYSASIPPHPPGTVVELWVEAIDTLGADASYPVAAPQELYIVEVEDPVPNELFINEFLASNDSFGADGSGEFDDWVELFNASTSTIDAGGMYLTDDLSQPTKWMIPLGTFVPAGGTLLVWADNDSSQGPLHASFKLSASGEALGLFDSNDNDNRLLDSLDFGPQVTDVSQGRLVDGGPFFFSLATPSPGAGNVPPPAGWTGYEAPSFSPAVSLTAKAPALTGGTWVGTVVGPVPNTGGLVALGFAPTQVNLGSDGVYLTLAVSSLLTPIATDAAGEGSMEIGIPSSAGLVGTSVFVQTYLLGAGFSNAVLFTIGS